MLKKEVKEQNVNSNFESQKQAQGITFVQRFSNFSMHQNHSEDLLKHEWPPSEWLTRSAKVGAEHSFSNKFPGLDHIFHNGPRSSPLTTSDQNQ
jgi:hypothetical protein